MNGAVASTTGSIEWATPQPLFDAYDYVFHFTLDAAATPENAKCRRFFTQETDGLAQDWGVNRVWLNPPYGDGEQPCKSNCTKKKCKDRGHIDHYIPGIKDWMKKAYEASLEGALVVCLVPASTDTRWWWEWAIKGDVKFLQGRVKFVGCSNAGPAFGSAIVIFWPAQLGFLAG